LVVPLGVAANSQISAAGDVVTVGFLVTKGTARKLSFTVKRGKGSKIVPTVAVFDPDGQAFDIVANAGKVSKAGATTWTGSFPDVPKTGLWRFEVRGDADSVGAFSATVKGKDTLKIPAPKSPPVTLQLNGKVDVPIEAGENTALTVSAKRAPGSQVLLQLSVLDRNNIPVAAPVSANSKNGTLSLKALRLPTFGAYTLRFTGGATGGSFTYAASTAAAKIKGSLPTATIDPAAGEPLLSTALSGHGAPVAGGALTYRWVQVSGGAVALTNADTANPTFTAPATASSLAFQFSVVEGTLLGKPATVSVEIAKRPIAYAGRSQSVAAGAAVSLDGSQSRDRRGKGLSYAWRQIPGDTTSVTLTGDATATPTFTAPNVPANLHFGLVVDDGIAKSTEDVVVVVAGDATKPVADAGRDQYVPRMASVQLCGLGSITPSTVLDLPMAWTQVSGPAVALAGATTPWPAFTAPKTPADYVFKLTINGNDAGADTVAVHVRTDETNLPAPAKGNGPLNSGPGNQPLQADTTGNPTVDPNGDALAYRWVQLRGAPLVLTNPTSATAVAAVTTGSDEYQFSVQAYDGLQYGAPDIVAIRTPGFNSRPIALAGPDRSVARGAAVSLDGRGSARTDGGSAPLTFQWTQLSGKDWFDFATSASATFNPAVAQPNVTLPADVSSLTSTRTVLFQLVVNDGTTSSSPDIVSVTYTSLLQNGLPTVTAAASDATPIAGEVVTLQGTSFDRDGDPLTYQWTQTQGTPVTLSPSSTVLSPTFVAPAAATPLKFTLVANDGIDFGPVSQPVTVTVDLPPVANIVVTPTSGNPGTVVTMDGAAASNPSTDPEGKPLTYTWRQISGTLLPQFTPAGTTVSTTAVSFTAPSGVITIGLKVTDIRGQVSPEKTAGFSPATPPVASPSITSGVDATTMPPILGAGSYVSYGSTVALAANGTGGGGPLSYTWRVVSQSPAQMAAISLSGGTTATPTFIVPSPTSSGAFGQTPQATFGVIATDGSQTSSEATITIRFFASLSNGTTAAASGTTVYGIVSGSCTSCHSGTSNSCPVGAGSIASGYGMGSPTAFRNNSRGVNACASSGAVRVPTGLGASSTSYLLQRLKGIATPTMPSTGSLTAAQIALFQDWIDQGSASN
jgi:protocatechuate 3,4-dioxygenase beta subunit